MTQPAHGATVIALHEQSGQTVGELDLPRNPGLAFDPDCFAGMKINRSATERRATSYGLRRSIKKQQQAAWLLKAISLIDLTTLAGDDTDARVRRLCAKAKQPLSSNLPQIVPYLQEQQDIRSEADPDLYYAKQVKAYRQDKVTSISLNLNQRIEEWAAKEQWYLDAINELRTKHGQAPVDDVQDHDFNYEEANNDPYLQSTAQVLLDWLRLAQ